MSIVEPPADTPAAAPLAVNAIPAAPSIKETVFDIDNLAGNLVTANLTRPDLLGTLGRANVGFNIPMPKLAPGTHGATLYLIDPLTLAATSLGQITFVVS